MATRVPNLSPCVFASLRREESRRSTAIVDTTGYRRTTWVDLPASRASQPSEVGQIGIGNAVGQLITPAIDALVEARYEPAAAAVARLAARHPSASSREKADKLVARYRKELGMVGAASGGAAALPGVGTAAGLGASGADVAWTVSRLGEMILSIGVAYGHGAEDVEGRRAWVMSVLAVSLGVAKGIGGVAGEIGQKGGIKVVKAIPMSQITRINQALGSRVIVKFGTQQGVVRLGRIVPFGIGAGIGAGGNVLLVNSVGRAARNFFDDGAEIGAPPAEPVDDSPREITVVPNVA